MNCREGGYVRLVRLIGQCGFFGLCILFLSHHLLLGQGNTSRVKHAVSCTSCSISVTKLRSIGSPDDTVLLSPSLLSLAIDSKRRVFSASFDRYQVVVFGADGSPPKILGKRGQGPGEFSSPIQRILTSRGDSLFVFQARRLTVFSPQLAFVRQVDLPVSGVIGLLPDGNILIGATIATPERIGHPYHIADPTGKIIKSFGYDGSPITATRRGPQPRPLSLSSDGKSLWTGPEGRRYSFLRRDANGTIVDSVEVVDVPWLKESSPTVSAPTSGRWGDTSGTTSRALPGTVIELLGVDQGGLLWTGIGHPIAFDSTTLQIRYSFRLEVFDPVARRILASRQFSEGIRLFNGTDIAVSPQKDSDGVTTYTLWRVAITR